METVERTGKSWGMICPEAVEVDRYHVVWDGGYDIVTYAVPTAFAEAEDARRADVHICVQAGDLLQGESFVAPQLYSVQDLPQTECLDLARRLHNTRCLEIVPKALVAAARAWLAKEPGSIRRLKAATRALDT